MMLRSISLRRFNVFIYVRVNLFHHELKWYEALDGKLLAMIMVTHTGEYNFIILARNKRNIFWGWEFSFELFKTYDDAENALKAALPKYINDGRELYEGHEKEAAEEFLKFLVPEEQLHAGFISLFKKENFAAKNLIKEFVDLYVNVDVDYIRDLQTSGFENKLWELYLYAFFNTSEFIPDKKFNGPEFLVTLAGKQFAFKAVTNLETEPANNQLPDNQDNLSTHYMEALLPELKKRNADADPFPDTPFTIAVHDVCLPIAGDTSSSLAGSIASLVACLYGIKRDDGIGNYQPAQWHEKEGAKITSGFFSLPEAENISAVLFSNNATIATFNRMGQAAGLGAPSTTIIRVMEITDGNPAGFKTRRVVKNVMDKDYEEAWADGLTMFHNPNARYPVGPEFFLDITHMLFDTENCKVYALPQSRAVAGSFNITEVADGDL